METEHCRDCCCARAWEALDVAEYDGKSIPEHIILLRDYAAEQSDLAADRKDEIRHHKAENQRLREALEAQADLYRELAARVDDDEDSLVAENTRLREALRTCQTMGHVDCLCLGVATDALKEKP